MTNAHFNHMIELNESANQFDELFECSEFFAEFILNANDDELAKLFRMTNKG